MGEVRRGVGWPVVSLIGVLALSAIVGQFWGAEQDRKALEAQIGQLEHERRVAVMRADSLEAAYHVDTVRLRVIRTQTDTMTVTVDQWKHDTVRVVEYVTKADSTIKVCSLALATCEERVGAVTARAVAAEAKADAYAHLKVPVLKYRTQGFVFGALAGIFLKR